MTPPNAIITVNDLDTALRVVITRASQIQPGLLFTIEFDDCTGARPPTSADFACVVEGAASSFGPVSGVTCTVAAQ